MNKILMFISGRLYSSVSILFHTKKNNLFAYVQVEHCDSLKENRMKSLVILHILTEKCIRFFKQ
jgi:hypothetical protein